MLFLSVLLCLDFARGAVVKLGVETLVVAPPTHWSVSNEKSNPTQKLSRFFANPEALLRLKTAVLMEQHDEWSATDRTYFAESSLRTLAQPGELDEGVTR